MACIGDAALARINSEVSVGRVVEGHGVVLRKQGADLVGACLFDGRRFDLCVRGGDNPTILSTQLKEAISLGQINLRYIP